MKKLIVILSILLTNNMFSQIQVNDVGFILQQYMRTKADRIEFITTHEDIASYVLHGATRIYDENNNMVLEISSNRLDSLLLNFPEFSKVSYQINYIPQFDELGIVIHETIQITKRFVVFRKNKESYSIQFKYLKNTSGKYDLFFNYINFPDVYI